MIRQRWSSPAGAGRRISFSDRFPGEFPEESMETKGPSRAAISPVNIRLLLRQ